MPAPAMRLAPVANSFPPQPSSILGEEMPVSGRKLLRLSISKKKFSSDQSCPHQRPIPPFSCIIQIAESRRNPFHPSLGFWSLARSKTSSGPKLSLEIPFTSTVRFFGPSLIWTIILSLLRGQDEVGVGGHRGAGEHESGGKGGGRRGPGWSRRCGPIGCDWPQIGRRSSGARPGRSGLPPKQGEADVGRYVLAPTVLEREVDPAGVHIVGGKGRRRDR